MKKIVAMLSAFSMMFSSVTLCFAQETEKEKTEMIDYGYVDCGDVKIEYGVYGKDDGETLLLLPPNGGDMHSLDNTILPEMSKHFRVITISPRGTGNSGWVDGTMNFETFADDVKTVLDYLGIEKERTRVEWVSAAEGAKFAATMNDFVEKVVALGENKRLEDLRCKR